MEHLLQGSPASSQLSILLHLCHRCNPFCSALVLSQLLKPKRKSMETAAQCLVSSCFLLSEPPGSVTWGKSFRGGNLQLGREGGGKAAALLRAGL